MRLIIAGTRDYSVPLDFIEHAMQIFALHPSEIVSGGACGIDRNGESFADQNGIDLTIFKADWDKYGKAAGPLRNADMADYADELLLVWDGTSLGSASMKKEMRKRKKPVHEIIIRSIE